MPAGWTIEPRLGIKWSPAARSSFALAYGLEKMDVYFANSKSTGRASVNKAIGNNYRDIFFDEFVVKMGKVR